VAAGVLRPFIGSGRQWGSGGGRSVRWVLTLPVLMVLKGGGGDSMGSRLDEEWGRGGATSQLLVVHPRGAALNGGGRSDGRWAGWGRIGNGLASVETKRKEKKLLKECGPKSSRAIEKSFFELFSRILIQNKEF
jgi:hypothetical protein